MINIKATRIDMYMVELLGQIHMMTEEEYIKFLENLDSLPRPTSRALQEYRNYRLRVLEETNAKTKVSEGEYRKGIWDREEPVEAVPPWEPETSVDDMAETVDESEVIANDTEIRPKGMHEEALDPKETEPEEVQPVATNEPEAQRDSNTKAVEAEDLLKEKGMVEKPEYQGKEPAIFEPTPEPDEKPKKVPRKWTTGDFDKYIAMAIDGAKRKEIMQAMAEDLDITPGNATQLFYVKVRPFVPLESDAAPEPEPEPAPSGHVVMPAHTPAPTAVEAIDIRSIAESVKFVPPVKPVHVPDYTKEVKAPKTLQEVAREYKVPMDVVSEIALMPGYDSARTFKDAVCIRESMNTKYQIEALKGVYRETHRKVRW